MTRDISKRLDASSGALIDGPGGRDRASPPQTVAGKIDAMGVVDQAIEDRIGVGRIADLDLDELAVIEPPRGYGRD